MLTRRISDHVREQNWFAVFVDVAIVILGVFLGLQVNNWNEARIANATAQTYYSRLAEDLHAEESGRAARTKYFEITRSHAEAALATLSLRDAQSSGQFLVDAYQATQNWNYVPQRTTYDELLSAGIANAIPDPDLRRKLANFYTGLEASTITLDEKTPYRDNLRRYMPHIVQTMVRDNCSDRYDFQAHGSLHLVLPDTCEVAFESRVVTDAADALRTYSDFESDLNRHLAILDAKLASLEAWVPPTRELATRLEGLAR